MLPIAILLGFAVLPLIVPVLRIKEGMRGASLASDFALPELATSEAARGAQLVGPYSRFGWRHPGPAYFYIMAPFYWASGANSASLPVAALVINWTALLAIITGLRRWADNVATSALALPLSIGYGGYLGAGFLYNIWNPAVTVLPFGLFLFLCAGISIGRRAGIPLAAAVGSFLVQTHVAYLPCVASTALLASAMFRSERRKDVAN